MNKKTVAILAAFIMFFVMAPLTNQKAEAAQQVDGHPATEISLGKWYYLDNVGATASDCYINSKYFYFKTSSRTDSKYKMYLTCSKGYSGLYPKYQGNGTWLFGYDYIKAQGGTSNSNYMWYWQGDSPANQIFGINAVVGDSDGKYVESHMKFMVKEIIALPTKGKITKATAGKKKVALRYSKLSKATRYQIAYKRSGSSYKYVTTTSTAKTIKGLKSKKYYYIKVRGQRYVDGTYYSGSWSTVKKIKVK